LILTLEYSQLLGGTILKCFAKMANGRRATGTLVLSKQEKKKKEMCLETRKEK
jgi:hypothetical protein